MSDPGSTYRTRDEIAGIRQVSMALVLPPEKCVPQGINIILNDLSVYEIMIHRSATQLKGLGSSYWPMIFILAHDFATAQELKVLFRLLRVQRYDRGAWP